MLCMKPKAIMSCLCSIWLTLAVRIGAPLLFAEPLKLMLRSRSHMILSSQRILSHRVRIEFRWREHLADGGVAAMWKQHMHFWDFLQLERLQIIINHPFHSVSNVFCNKLVTVFGTRLCPLGA